MNRSRLIILSAVLIVVALVAGLALSDRPGLSLGPNMTTLVKADELPATAPDVSGIFERRDANSLFVGTNIVRFDRVKECDDCPAHKNIVYNGPVVEVVVTHNTVIYADATSFDTPAVDGRVQQVIEPGSLDDIGPEAVVWVWGERQGDRLVARVLVYDYLPD